MMIKIEFLSTGGKFEPLALLEILQMKRSKLVRVRFKSTLQCFGPWCNFQMEKESFVSLPRRRLRIMFFSAPIQCNLLNFVQCSILIALNHQSSLVRNHETMIFCKWTSWKRPIERICRARKSLH